MPLRAWIQASRPLAQVNIAVPLLLGEMLAYAGGAPLDVGLLVLAHGFGVLDQLFIVWANDVADEAADRVNEAPTPFSGGSRVLPEGKLHARQLARAAIGAALAMLGVSLYAAIALDRPAMPLAWALAVVLSWAYGFPPARLSYRGMGAVTQAFGVMVVLPLIGFYLQAGDVRGFPWPALLPCVALGLASNITTALPDHAADEATGKRTWPVRYGVERARKHVLQLVALGALGAPLVLPHSSQATWAAVEAVPLLLVLVDARTLRRPHEPSRERTLRFVIRSGAAINAALLGWIVALVLSIP
ncbi:prenyltransferase [Paraliomyxa miuraensis]|uniref:prenyltransferase n=1 Tax=Paraliomyxa miuraensis TaxID=376150 RepID=UPI0022551595|nr:prenyltransferase [Paraliomyxa miuraensis]MCX4247811.1 prenyltransferase [Paraliomyxa miuraensis]